MKNGMEMEWMCDWFVLLCGLVQWLILLIDVLFIHDFEGMYQEIVIAASVFTIMGAVIMVIFHLGE